MKNVIDLAVATEESAKFIDAALADNGKPDFGDLFKSMPMIDAVKEAVVDVTEIHAELHAASEEELREWAGEMAMAQRHLCESICALVKAVKPF